MKNALRIYKSLLRLYPHRYRKEFGEQMTQTIIDCYKDTEQSKGIFRMRFWLPAIADEIQNVARQHLTSLTAEGNFLKVTAGRLIISAMLFIPLYAIFGVLLVRISLALPHPHISGVGVLIAFALLLVLPGIVSAIVSYLLASALLCIVPKRKESKV